MHVDDVIKHDIFLHSIVSQFFPRSFMIHSPQFIYLTIPLHMILKLREYETIKCVLWVCSQIY